MITEKNNTPVVDENSESENQNSISALTKLCVEQSKKIDELQLLNEQSTKTIRDYDEALGEYREKYQNAQAIVNKKDRRVSKILGWNILSLLTVTFVAFNIGACCNGCAANEQHILYPEERIHSIEPISSTKCRYILWGNGHHVVLHDKRGKFNVGDTLIITKK